MRMRKVSIWAEGKYIDLWTLNHLLSGFVLAGTLALFHVTTIHIVEISTVLFWGWELFERVYGLEKIWNQLVDIIADYTGLSLFLSLFGSGQPHALLFVVGAAILFIVLERIGYVYYQRYS